jgi:hypothetical protein
MPKERKTREALTAMIGDRLAAEGHTVGGVTVRIYPNPGGWDAEVVGGNAAAKSAAASLVRELRTNLDLVD